MTFGKIVRSISVGFLFGIIAIGLLPFLAIYNWAELISLTELEASPIIVLIGKLTGDIQSKRKRDSAHDVVESESSNQ